MKRNLLTLLIIFLSVIYGGNNLSAQNDAKVGNKEYATIDEAIANWTNGTTLTLLADVNLNDVIQLLSTGSYYLDLSKYTMTAASGKHAIEIICKDRVSEGNCLTIYATSGGITASGKSCIYYKNPNKTKDRPGINIYGGVFNGSNSISCTTQQRGTNNPRFTIYGGTFNATISISYGILDTRGGCFNCSLSCWGDSSSFRQIAGGTFKSGFTGTIEATKFWFGTAKDTYNVGVYVNEDLYLVVGGPVITDYSEDYPCSTTYSSYSTWSTPLTYSSANPSKSTNKNGLYWSSIKLALDKNNSSSKTVNIHTDTLDLSAEKTKYIYNGTIKLPKEDSEFTVIYKTEPTLKVESGINGISVAKKDFEGVPSSGLTTRVYSLCPELINGGCPHVARACGNHYNKLNDALNANNVTDGDVITLIKNTSEEVIALNKNVTINFNGKTCTNTNTEGLVISNGKTITLTGGTLIAENADYVISTSGNLTIQDMTINGTVEYFGGELITDKSFNIAPKKEFDGIGAVQGQIGWSTISTPIAGAKFSEPEENEGIHDLYRFNEADELWEYYKDDGNSENGVASNPFDELELGHGYLYANSHDIIFKLGEGELNTEKVVFPLSYTEGNSLAGFNMIGNPFTYSIDNDNMSPSVKLAEGFYVVGAEGTWTAKADGKIAPMESVLIQANGKGTLTMSPANTGSKRAARNENSYLTINVASKTHSDVAHISFNEEGMGLDKINHRNPDNPMLYIPVEGKNYAIAMMDKDVKEVPVYFNANRMAEYTISIEQKNCEFSSVVLVDKLTGIETNLLIEDYSFMARTFDDANRFVIRMSIEDNDDSETENFAYVSNGSIVIEKIEGNANIRIFDIMGRHIMGTDATGNANIPVETMSTGMYIIQMADDNGVKVQKIIIE